MDDFLRVQTIYPGHARHYSTSTTSGDLTSQPGAADYFANTRVLANYGLDAFHPSYSTIMVPLPWLECLILQSGTPAIGLDAGVESLEIDFNQFNGDVNKFRSYFRLSGEPSIPPQEEGIMYRYEATNLYPNMSLRRDHNTAAALIRQFAAGSKWYGNTTWTAPADVYLENGTKINAAGDVWLEVANVNGGAYSGWVAVTHLGAKYCELVDNQPPAPEPVEETPPDWIEAHWLNGTVKKYVPE